MHDVAGDIDAREESASVIAAGDRAERVVVLEEPVGSGDVVLPLSLPELVVRAGPRAVEAFGEYFTARLRTRNTRQAYARAVCAFFDWLGKERRGVGLVDLRPHHVADYVEVLGEQYAPATVQQHLAAIRGLFDWLARRHAIEWSPAATVRAPRVRSRASPTPALEKADVGRLLAAIPSRSVVGLRDRALILFLLSTWSRVSAALAVDVEDLVPQGGREWVHLVEKGTLRHRVPLSGEATAAIAEYCERGGVERGALFRSVGRGRGGSLTDRRLDRRAALAMLERRSRQVDLEISATPHVLRATGITAYLDAGGEIEMARRIAGHASVETTRRYDRREVAIDPEEIERGGGWL